METAVTILAILGAIAATVAVAVLFLRLVDRLTAGRSPSAEEQAAAAAEYEWRLRNPRFAELESHFGQPLPAELRALYENTGLILRQDIHVRTADAREEDFIARFLPADCGTLEDWEPDPGRNAFPFATDDFGNCYYVYLGAHTADRCPVFFLDHDGGEITQVAGSIGDFTERCIIEESDRRA